MFIVNRKSLQNYINFNRILWKPLPNDTFKILQPLPNCKFDKTQPLALADNPYLNLDYSGYLQKPESNNNIVSNRFVVVVCFRPCDETLENSRSQTI